MTKEAKDKKEFVEELGKLLANFNESHGTNYFSGIKRMDYVEEDGEEFAYITYEKYTQKTYLRDL